MQIFKTHSSVEGHLDYFQFLSIMNKAAMNTVKLQSIDSERLCTEDDSRSDAWVSIRRGRRDSVGLLGTEHEGSIVWGRNKGKEFGERQLELGSYGVSVET